MRILMEQQAIAKPNTGSLMKLLTDWGFGRAGWQQGARGEYWVLAQALLLLGMVFLPPYRPWGLQLSLPWLYGVWGSAVGLGLTAVILLGKGLLDLGQSLTPLPYPKDDGQLVQVGVYGIVRHPIYSGVILGVLAWALYQLSLTHVAAAIAFFLFFNAKAHREELWLADKYPDYAAYQQRVKKLIPGVY